MKNYLVKSLFKINSANWDVKDRSNELDLYEKYVESHNISVQSFEKHLQGDWEYVFIEGEFDTIHQALHKTFYTIHELWHSEPCNILYTDPDTIAIQPVHIWDRYNKFMMFAFSDPKSFYKQNSYGLSFKNFFNAGVRYFPATMSEDTWQNGLALANNWEFDNYDTEQIILNHMLWSQGLKLHEALNPYLAYQAHWLPGTEVWKADLWNGIHANQASILHVHGSRDIDQKLAFMKTIYGQL